MNQLGVRDLPLPRQQLRAIYGCAEWNVAGQEVVGRLLMMTLMMIKWRKPNENLILETLAQRINVNSNLERN